MLWFIIALVGYLLNAVATLISKWLLIEDIPEPVVFTFYIGVLNLLALVLIPFGVSIPSAWQIMISLISGIAYAWGMYMLAKALSSDQASQVAPMVGGLQPIFVILFAIWFLPEVITKSQYMGFVIVILGSILIALEIGKKHWYSFRKKHIFTESIKYILLSSVFFGLSYALLKLVYIEQGFVSGFFWTRVGTFVFVIALALIPGNWKLIRKSSNKSGTKAKGWFMAGQVIGALSFLLVSYAISIGPVTVINALQGVQYILLFILIVILSRKYKHLLDEPLTKKIIIQKVTAIILIIVGLWFVV